jgi:transglutaminase-like putative cysteine protease
MNLAQQKRIRGMHKLSIYAVITIAYLCVVFGGGVGPLMTIGFGVALPASWFVDRAGLIDASFAKWWNLLILAFVGVTFLQILTTDESIISAAIRFVLLLTTVKLFGRFAERDDLQIYALSFLLFASATAVNEGVTYGILFGLYTVAGTFSMALFHLKIEVEDHSGLRGSNRMPFDRQYMMVLGAISVMIFMASLAIFFVFPRVGMGFFVTQSREQTSVTGFSESVELGSHGKIRDNPEVVMRVEFPDGRPSDYETIHWRTMTFDSYDGNRWSQTIADSEKRLPSRDDRYLLQKVQPEWRKGFSRDAAPMPLEIYLEPIGTNLLPRLWPTGTVAFGNSELDVPWNPNSGDVTIDAYGDLRHTFKSEVGVPYTITALGKPDPDTLRLQEFTPDHIGPDSRYLQRPVLSSRFKSLVDDLTGDLAAPYAKAEVISTYLQDNYQYTTDLPEVDDSQPIEDFVFETQRGHCEYFATTAVLMLRKSGVPARLVNGFLGGRWNNVGDYLSVRQGDAHSWAEIYVPNFGWTPIDPTPAADVLPTQPSAVEQWYRDVYDAARLNWMKWVIEYDLASQIELVKDAGRFLAPKSDAFDTDDQNSTENSSTGWIDTRSLMVGVAVVVGVLALIWLVRRLLRHRGRTLAVLFSKLERAGKAAHIERAPDEGPGAYLGRLSSAFPQASSELAAFRQRYLAVRFGGRSPGTKQMKGLARLVETIRKRLRRSAK